MLDSAVRPSVGPPSTQSPRKLRDSCTDCASSKVKCSKDKPTCARCARRGVTCTYMVSRRTGRTSSTASKGEPTQIWIGASGTQRPSLRVGTPLLPQATITSSTQDGLGGQTPDAGFGPGPETDLWNSILSPSVLMADPAGLSPPLTTIGTDVGELFDLGLHSPMVLDCPEQVGPAEANHHPTPDIFGDMDLSVSPPDFATTHTHSHTSAFDWTLPSGTSTPPSCCFTVALDILTRLFPNAPSSCTLPGTPSLSGSLPSDGASPKARTIDSVISENKQIIESLTNLLDCHCSQDEYLISIMTLIALKVMGWYSAAAADDSLSPSPSTPSPPQPLIPSWPGPGPGIRSAGSASGSGSGSASPTDRRPSSASSVGGPLGEQVLRLPATVGNYCVAGQHQGRMAAQLVLSELHRVQRLVNALSKRLESIRLRAGRTAGSSASSSGLGSVRGGDGGGGVAGVVGVARAPPFSVPTFCQLEEDLRKRLRVLSSETIDVLRRA
ncbi:hypothetical protein NEMBOFW57_010729 [Staphylotrichum longicolle]|uniref:Zn(2)-C6 fungal-type domain-containing protein n=1 Tax=Staphylotrichum longicolle TaxID=669026 RepID=A0AAD4HV13_9PEZI|nr:hypothetical protein NEMBOFW57_010729 [Staphylotrichum longicolle]